MGQVILTSEIEQIKWFSTRYTTASVFDEDDFGYKFIIDNRSNIFFKRPYGKMRIWLRDHCAGDVIIYCNMYHDIIIFDNPRDMMTFTLTWGESSITNKKQSS